MVYLSIQRYTFIWTEPVLFALLVHGTIAVHIAGTISLSEEIAIASPRQAILVRGARVAHWMQRGAALFMATESLTAMRIFRADHTAILAKDAGRAGEGIGAVTVLDTGAGRFTDTRTTLIVFRAQGTILLFFQADLSLAIKSRSAVVGILTFHTCVFPKKRGVA